MQNFGIRKVRRVPNLLTFSYVITKADNNKIKVSVRAENDTDALFELIKVMKSM